MVVRRERAAGATKRPTEDIGRPCYPEISGRDGTAVAPRPLGDRGRRPYQRSSYRGWGTSIRIDGDEAGVVLVGDQVTIVGIPPGSSAGTRSIGNGVASAGPIDGEGRR